LFLATGKHELRGISRNAEPAEALVGFKMYFHLNREARQSLAGQIVLILFRHGYAGMQLVEGEKANLCLLVTRDYLRRVGSTWPALLAELCRECPTLAHLLVDSRAQLTAPLTIYRVPYGYVHRSRATDPTMVFRLGDQAAVIPSFTGDGMAIALHSAAAAVDCYLKGNTAAVYHRQLSADISWQIKRASLLYRLASANHTQAMFFNLAVAFPQALGRAASLTRIPAHTRRTAAAV
jgi:flavin-dependent dehydrogenase